MNPSQNNFSNKPNLITNTSAIPSELKDFVQWVCFKFEGQNKKGKWTKVPYQVNGRKASVTNPKNWAAFSTVELHASLDLADGIGFVFTKNDPYCGIDLDNCVDPITKTIASWALRWLKLFQGAYMEFSPSGTGIKLITKAKLPSDGKKKGNLEIYDKARYFTVTGHAYGTIPKEIPQQQAAVDQFLSEVFVDSSDSSVNKLAPLEGKELTEEEIRELIKKAENAKNGGKFKKLFAGNFDHKSHSEADAALCTMLAFYTNCNEAAMDQIFRESALYREKWDRSDYRAGTIRKAIRLQHKNNSENDFTLESETALKDDGPFPIIHISDVEETNLEFQIDELWPVNSVGIISGQPGICKTWFSEELTLSVAAGIKAFGKFPAKKGMVLIFNAEDDPARITKQRIKGFCKTHKIDIKKIDFHLIKIPSMDLGLDETQNRLRKTIAKYKPTFIVLDPLRNIHSLDEDNASKMAPLLRFLRELNREFGCSILLVCHDRKPSKENKRRASQTRGSNALEGWRDTAFYLDEVDHVNKITQVQVYHRGAPAILPFFIKLNVTLDDSNKIKSAELAIVDKNAIVQVKEEKLEKEIMDLLKKNGHMTRTQIREKLNVQNNSCRAAIQSLIDFGFLNEIQKGRHIYIEYAVQPGTGTPS